MGSHRITFIGNEVKHLNKIFANMEEAELRRILSSNIKHYRSIRGWSQETVAEKIETSTNFLAIVENGKSWVSSLTLVKLANCFGVEVYELFRPKNAPDDRTKETVKSLTKDISSAFEDTLSEISKKYLS